jgi:hypothetical protein
MKSGDIILEEILPVVCCAGNAMYKRATERTDKVSTLGNIVLFRNSTKDNKHKFFPFFAHERTDITQVEQISLSARFVDKEVMKVREGILCCVPAALNGLIPCLCD